MQDNGLCFAVKGTSDREAVLPRNERSSCIQIKGIDQVKSINSPLSPVNLLTERAKPSLLARGLFTSANFKIPKFLRHKVTEGQTNFTVTVSSMVLSSTSLILCSKPASFPTPTDEAAHLVCCESSCWLTSLVEEPIFSKKNWQQFRANFLIGKLALNWRQN